MRSMIYNAPIIDRTLEPRMTQSIAGAPAGSVDVATNSKTWSTVSRPRTLCSILMLTLCGCSTSAIESKKSPSELKNDSSLKVNEVTIYFEDSNAVHSSASVRINDSRFMIRDKLQSIFDELARLNPSKIFIVIGKAPPSQVDTYVKEIVTYANNKKITVVVTDLS